MDAPLQSFDPDRFDILLEFCEGTDLSMVEQIVSQYQEDLIPVLERLERGICERDFKKVSDAAHTLKGSGATFGLLQVEAGGRELQETANAQDLPGVIRWRDHIANALAVGLPMMEAHLADLKLGLRRGSRRVVEAASLPLRS